MCWCINSKCEHTSALVMVFVGNSPSLVICRMLKVVRWKIFHHWKFNGCPANKFLKQWWQSPGMTFPYAEVVKLPFHQVVTVFSSVEDFILGCKFELLNEKTVCVVTKVKMRLSLRSIWELHCWPLFGPTESYHFLHATLVYCYYISDTVTSNTVTFSKQAILYSLQEYITVRIFVWSSY